VLFRSSKSKKAEVEDEAEDEAEVEATSCSVSSTVAPGEEATSLKLLSVSYELPDALHSGEGRTITVEFDKFYLVNCYVPNSGQALERLDYRTTQWDPFLYEYLKALEAKKPVVLTGDLNVAHLDIDIYNVGAKHTSKQAGLTPQERESFSRLLHSGFQDALRFFYPEHLGQFSYWSQRTRARPGNRGLRIDYFMCSRSLFPPGESPSEESQNDNKEGAESQNDNKVVEVLDSSILFDDAVGCSDHCPLLLTLRL